MLVAAVSYDPTTNKATLNPNEELQAGKTYSAKVKGGSTGVKDSAGNPLAAEKVWSFTTLPPPIDTTSPRVTSTVPTAGTYRSRPLDQPHGYLLREDDALIYHHLDLQAVEGQP